MSSEQYERQIVTLAIISRAGAVAAQQSGGNWSLPAVTIPRFVRSVEAVTAESYSRFGLRLFVIFSAKSRTSHASLMVARLQRGEDLPTGFCWRDRKSLAETLPPDTSVALQQALDECSRYDSGALASNFARYSALDDLRTWYEPILATQGLREAHLRQYNGDAFFALFQIVTESCSGNNRQAEHFWVKAVGEPNIREFGVTQKIVKEFPWNSPTVLATKPEWNAWLMEDVGGYELDVQLDGRPWGITGRHFAQIQTRFIDCEDELLALGCADWRGPEVLTRVEPFFEHMASAMDRQPTSPPPRLTRQELREMATQCGDLCHRVEDLLVPDTLAHGDFSPHNVLIRWGWPIFIDWAESYVTFPFITWEYHKRRFLKDHPEHAHWLPRMQDFYERQWLGILGERRAAKAFELAPAYAILIRALYRGNGDIRDGLDDGSEPAKRSLVRGLQRELNATKVDVASV